VLEALLHSLGLEAPYLRPTRILRDDDGGLVRALHELDAPDRGWAPPAGTGWMPLDEVNAESLAPPGLADAVGRWIAEQRGVTVPEERPPWARPGWLAEATRWMEERVAALGLSSTGPVEVVEQWPLSSVLRLETDGGRVYLKAVFSIFRHEPALTKALSEWRADVVPEVLAVDPDLGLILMRELRGTQVGELEHARWSEALVVAAAVQRGWVGREAELFALGAHDRTLAALAAEIGSAFDTVGLPRAGVVPELERRCAELARGPLPQTLVHGDLHPWNVMVDDTELRIFDWSDACVSHPLFDLQTFLQRCDDAGARDAMLEAYLDVWSDHGSPAELRAAFELAHPLACAHHAISYLRIVQALELDDRWLFADEPGHLLALAVELLEAAR
jgi:hypothetical protein